mgnify:CR=1 FL=1
MRRAVVVVVALLGAAVLVAGLWVLIAPAANLTVEHDGTAGFTTEADPAKLFDGVAVFALLAMGLGVVIALASWFGLRSTRGPGGLLFVTVMSIATAAIALQLSEVFTRSVRADLDPAAPGAYQRTGALWLDGSVGPSWLLLICAPAAALLVYLVCVISCADADLGRGDGDREATKRPPVPVSGPAGEDFVPIGSGPVAPASLTSADEAPRTRP